MKKWTIALAFVVVVACSPDDSVSPGSNIRVDPPSNLTTLDQWIADNYTDPYNIEIVYRWSESLVDQGRFLHPPHIDSVRPALKIVKKLWIEPYNVVSGTPFVQAIAPRQLVLVGGLNLNPSGTITLGLAEAGKRITLFNTNLLNKTNRGSITRFIKTIQHEYAHIMNQTRPFDEATYNMITPEGYTAQWFNESDRNSQRAGFISAYARAAPGEDFAEMVAEMLTRSRTEWNQFVDGISVSKAVADIRQKEQIVTTYYQREFNINMYELQDSIYQATLRLF